MHSNIFDSWFAESFERTFQLTPRESKSQNGLAIISQHVFTQPGVVYAARLRHLRSGHSHEDIDQIFGRLAAHMSKHARHATGPHDFRSIIQDWLDSKLDRPHELGRHAVILDQCRDWKLEILLIVAV